MKPAPRRPADHRWADAGPRCERRRAAGKAAHSARSPEASLAVSYRTRTAGGEAGHALAGAQGRALTGLLSALATVEVGQGEEERPP
jgi:hypothetical protein